MEKDQEDDNFVYSPVKFLLLMLQLHVVTSE